MSMSSDPTQASAPGECAELHQTFRVALQTLADAVASQKAFADGLAGGPGAASTLTPEQVDEHTRLQQHVESATRMWEDSSRAWLSRCGGTSP